MFKNYLILSDLLLFFFIAQIQEVNYLANNTYLLLRLISGKLERTLKWDSKDHITTWTWGSHLTFFELYVFNL